VLFLCLHGDCPARRHVENPGFSASSFIEGPIAPRQRLQGGGLTILRRLSGNPKTGRCFLQPIPPTARDDFAGQAIVLHVPFQKTLPLDAQRRSLAGSETPGASRRLRPQDTASRRDTRRTPCRETVWEMEIWIQRTSYALIPVWTVLCNCPQLDRARGHASKDDAEHRSEMSGRPVNRKRMRYRTLITHRSLAH